MKNHIPLTYLLLAVFIVYAYSPLTITLSDSQISSSLQDPADISPGLFNLVVTGGLFHALFSNAAESSGESGTILILRKKRAVIRNNYQKINPELLKETPAIHALTAVSMSVSAFYSPFDQLYSYRSCDGFLLFSGISPPV